MLFDITIEYIASGCREIWEKESYLSEEEIHFFFDAACDQKGKRIVKIRPSK